VVVIPFPPSHIKKKVMNWIKNKENITESDVTALNKAKAMEQRYIKNGHKYVKITDSIKVLVPFGKDGKPTKDGDRIIRNIKEKLL
jgi:hypothetical protein